MYFNYDKNAIADFEFVKAFYLRTKNIINEEDFQNTIFNLELEDVDEERLCRSGLMEYKNSRLCISQWVLCHRTESSGISGLYWNCCRSAGSDRNACDDNRHGQMEGNICTAGSRSTHSCNSLRLDHCSTTSFSIACEIYLPNFKCCSGCGYHFYRFECKAGKKTTKKSKNI